MTTAAAIISWRKQALLNRAALLSAWPRLFPRRSIHSLRLHGPSIVPPGWNDEDVESWCRAAREYNEDRRKWGRR